MSTIEAKCTACGKAKFAMTDDFDVLIAAYKAWDERHKAVCPKQPTVEPTQQAPS
jgi:hypothetical protein